MLDKNQVRRFEDLLRHSGERYSEIYVMQPISEILASLLKSLNLPITGSLSSENILNLFEDSSQSALVIREAKYTSYEPEIKTFLHENRKSVHRHVISIHKDMLSALYDKMLAEKFVRECSMAHGHIDIHYLLRRFAHGASYLLNEDHPVIATYMEKGFRKLPVFPVKDVAIILQGPLRNENNFTLSTVDFYRSLYPKATIIVSTWKGEATEEFRKACDALSVIVLESELPKISGASHVNYQLTSSLNAVRYAKRIKGINFVLKTRTDQRIYKPDFLVHMKNLLKLYPVCGGKLKERMIFLGAVPNTALTHPFLLSDHLVFGAIEEMESLYSAPHQTQNESYLLRHMSRYIHIASALRKLETVSPIELCSSKRLMHFMHFMEKYISPEHYILRCFYEKNIAKINTLDVLRVYWKFLRDYVVLLDWSDLSIYWSKYDQYETAIFSLYMPENYCALNHARWLDLYLNSNEWLGE